MGAASGFRPEQVIGPEIGDHLIHEARDLLVVRELGPGVYQHLPVDAAVEAQFVLVPDVTFFLLPSLKPHLVRVGEAA